MDHHTTPRDTTNSNQTPTSWFDLPAKSDDLMAVSISGQLSEKDLLRLLSDFDQRKPSKLLLRFDGIFRYPRHLWRHPIKLFQIKKQGIKTIDRYAIVGGPKWLKHTVNFINPLFRMEVRYFPKEEEEAAWTWVDGPQLNQKLS